MKKSIRRILGITLALAMIFSCVAFSTLGNASEGGKNPTRVICTINGDCKTSRGFSWATTESAASDLQVKDSSGATTTFSGTANKFKDYYMHKVEATGLKAGSTYTYKVGDASANIWSKEGTFKTDGGGEFSFITIADVQASNREGFQHGAKVLNAALNVLPNAAFHVSLGDYVNDCTNEEWDYFFEEFEGANLRTTHAPVAGNHDGNLKWNWFKNMFNLEEQPGSINLTGTYYSFDYGDAHFAVLNTNDMYPMTMQQRNWLINDMSQSDATWKILLTHRAPYSAGKNMNKPDTLIMRSVLLPLIDELGIDMVLSGHDHMYYRSYQLKDEKILSATSRAGTSALLGETKQFLDNPDGTVYILPNTAGTKRYRVYQAMAPILDSAELAFQPEKSVFSTLNVTDHQLEYVAYTYDEETGKSEKIDEYFIYKTEADGAVENYEPLPTDFVETLPNQVKSLAWEFVRVLIFDYLFKLLPQAIVGLFS